LIRERIVTLDMAPGAPINPRHLAEALDLGLIPIKEALRLLEYDGLVVITPRQEHGVYVSSVHLEDLDQLSELRLTLEARSARLAAQRATADDVAVLEALRDEQARVPPDDVHWLFDIDHRFHRAVAQAAHNQYLADALERFFALSQRLWYLALPHLDFLPAAVQKHLDLVDAIEARDADRAAQIMRDHVEDFYNRVRQALTLRVTVSYGSDVRSVVVEENALLGGAILATGLPLEQPCAGRGTCGKCRVLVEGELSPPDEVERKRLTPAELAAGYRLACRARLKGDATVTLAPIVVYSNKIFRACDDYKREGVALGLAIDLGSTTVAAFLTLLADGNVCAGAAALNQQTVFGADVISRLAVAQQGAEQAARLSTLARASILQAVDALRLSRQVKERIQRVTVVGNCAMHHLLLQYPVETLIALPFQPYDLQTVQGSARDLLGNAFPARAEALIPPLIGGFVGSDALACLIYYGFDRAPGPIAAIDLGTNGEVMVTDGHRILVASTAAGPAFEGVNISCGTRAVDGAIVGVEADARSGDLEIATIGDHPPVGLTGSGLLDLVYELRRVGVIDPSGRITADHPTFGRRIDRSQDGVRRFLITERGVDLRGAESIEEADQVPLYLTQHDIRELQKAKAAIRAATEVLMARLDVAATDLQRMILTGSFGSQLNVQAVRGVGLIPSVDPQMVETSANGAGFGAALMLDGEQFARGERIAAQAEQVDLDLDPRFNDLYIGSMMMSEVA
jgi:uncharacterized 2Fe-2S/4Fe-4S cluster protein (DUF4445 family)/DNA-binding GntR family transcriptional regulator